MAVRRRKIKQVVDEILAEAKITEAPVPVWNIAKNKGARIVVDSLEGDLSGFIYRDGSQAVIGVNTHHAQVRQNFTLAHELGHLLLHDTEELHVDHAFPVVHLRNDVSSQGTDSKEKEANLFAAELLMPSDFLQKDLANLDSLDLYDEKTIPDLAQKYGVSTQALMYRLQYLGYLQD